MNTELTIFWTYVYAADAKSMTKLLVHHNSVLTSSQIMTAITVWAAAFAVPLILWVSAEVTCKGQIAFVFIKCEFLLQNIKIPFPIILLRRLRNNLYLPSGNVAHNKAEETR